MTIAASSSTWFLSGLAVLSIGVLVLSLGLLAAELKWKSTMHQNAQRTYDTVSPEVPHLRQMMKEAERLALKGNVERRFREGEEQLWQSYETFHQEVDALRSIHEGVMDMSIDELGFLTNEEESNVAMLTALFQIDERLRASPTI